MSSIISCNLDPFFFSHLQYFLLSNNFFQVIVYSLLPLMPAAPNEQHTVLVNMLSAEIPALQ